MKLVKYCKKEHRIDNCQTIRLGTFNGYQFHEKDEIQDENEGISDGFHIAQNEAIHPTTLEEIERLSSIPNFIKFQNIDPNNIPNITIKDVKIIRKTNLTNCFLFSCSESPLNFDLMKKLGYDDYYEIIDTQKFSNLITKYLAETLGKRDYKESEIVSNWEKVEYTNLPIMPDPLKATFSDFTKKKTRFAFQQEFRLIFLLYSSNHLIIPIKENFIDLDITDELRRYCNFD